MKPQSKNYGASTSGASTSGASTSGASTSGASTSGASTSGASTSGASRSGASTKNMKCAARTKKVKKNIDDTDKLMKEMKELNEFLHELEQNLERKENTQIEQMNNEVLELQAKLSLSNLRRAEKEKEWRDRIMDEEETHAILEKDILGLLDKQRVMAFQYRLQTTFSHVTELLQSPTRATWQTCTEEIPQQERAVENYTQKAIYLEAKIMSVWTKWDVSRKKLDNLYNLALYECPDLIDFVEKLKVESKLRLSQARADLKHKLFLMEYKAMNDFAESMSGMPKLLKKLFLSLKDYGTVTPALTAQYLEIVKKAKFRKRVTWSDEVACRDAQLNLIRNLSLEKPVSLEFLPSIKSHKNATVDIATNSNDLPDVENKELVTYAKKIEETRIKFMINEYVIVNDSVENLGTLKMVKKKIDSFFDLEYCGLIHPKDQNSTFEGMMEDLKKTFEADTVKVNPTKKRKLADKANTTPRSVNFSAVGVCPDLSNWKNWKTFNNFCTAWSLSPTSDQQAEAQKDDVVPKVGYKLSRERTRAQLHPYFRPAAQALSAPFEL